MSKIFEALEKAKQEKQPAESYDLVPTFDISPKGLEELVVLNSPESHIAECFRFLRARITRPASGSIPRTILVTSALMEEGKTFVACNLAVSISQSLEEHVLLIDADLRSPRVHKVFGLRAYKEGLSTTLSGDVPVESLLRKPDINKLTILPAGNSTITPSELISSVKMKRLIQEVRERYADRFVIIDSAPLEVAPESSVIANEVDAIIMLVRHGKTPRDVVKTALHRLQKEKVIGIVYNGHDEPFKKYGRYPYHDYGK